MKREDVLRHPAYWFEDVQNELYSQVVDYMDREKINRSELAKRLKVSKGYVSQILNGNYNYTLKKWIELCLAIGIVPGVYRKLDDVIEADKEFARAKKDAIRGETTTVVDLDKISSINLKHLKTGTSTASGGHKIAEYEYREFSPYTAKTVLEPA